MLANVMQTTNALMAEYARLFRRANQLVIDKLVT